jgi:hypothetical protein
MPSCPPQSRPGRWASLAWGINLDFDHDDRLVGIEFESADQAPRGSSPVRSAPRADRGFVLEHRGFEVHGDRAAA